MAVNNSQLNALRALHKLYLQALECAELLLGPPACYEARDEEARAAWRQFQRRVIELSFKIDPARRQLIACRFDAPLEWLAVEVIGTQHKTTSMVDGTLFTEAEYKGVDVSTLRKICNEIRAWILKLECNVKGLTPADDSAWVPAHTLWRGSAITTNKELDKFKSLHPDMFHKPSKNRLNIHAGKWVEFWAKHNGSTFDDLDDVNTKPITSDDLSEDFIEGAQKLYKDVFQGKQPRKQ